MSEERNSLTQPTGSIPLVLVEWLDSLQPVQSWSYFSDLPKLDVARCRTVGWVVNEDDSVLMLAQNVADLEDSDPQGSGYMRIPKVCITKQERLK